MPMSLDEVSVMAQLKKDIERPAPPLCATVQQGASSSEEGNLSINQLNAYMSAVLPGGLWPDYFVVKAQLEGRTARKYTQTLIAIDCHRLLRLLLNRWAIDLALGQGDQEVTRSDQISQQLRNFQGHIGMMKWHYGKDAPMRWDGREKTAMAHFDERFRHFEEPI